MKELGNIGNKNNKQINIITKTLAFKTMIKLCNYTH